MRNNSTDLRVVRTKLAIRNALCAMITEMDYQDITVKELVRRAMINRNTFYLHYSSIDDLLEELQNEIAENFISMYISYENVQDVQLMIRRFFEYVTSLSPMAERLFCGGSYRFIAEGINRQISQHRKQTRRGTLALSEAAEDIVFSYCGSVAAILYRQWVVEGKQLPLEELVELATRLICSGMESVIKQ